MTIYLVNPLIDRRWEALTSRHPRASAFHTTGWLQAIHNAYGYQPLVLTTSAPEAELTNGLVVCTVHSWVTGRRIVSLPFSDHCDPLVDSAKDLECIVDYAKEWVKRDKYSHFELRPLHNDVVLDQSSTSPHPFETHYIHFLSLEPTVDDIFQQFHKSSIQRRIKRAEKEGLTHKKGSSEELMRQFYGLLIRTRRRHCLPPQPYRWFQELTQAMGQALTVHLAYLNSQPIAAILILMNKDTVMYKYGCSDERYNNLGGTPFLFWKVISESRLAGFRGMDLGRSETDNEGLITFKEHLGATRNTLRYFRLFSRSAVTASRPGWGQKAARWSFRHMPDSLLVTSGKLLYRHMG